ncbi:MAG: hypothetical protein RQ760_03610 [Sedimentisphaerales bacterium]|nr:hypothetical protein [Sedimentisphaerales bacterium]
MKRHQADDEVSIRTVLDYLNVCHDGYLRRISFIKDRDYTSEGNVFYPYEKEGDEIKCDIDVELLLDSYKDALPQQVVVLHFKEVRSFQFFQEKTFDYSEIYEVIFNKSGESEFEFIFRARVGVDRIDMLRIICSKIICTELGK